jgi:hypothetical protein
MLDPKTMQAHARKLVLDIRSAIVDIDAPAVDHAMPTSQPQLPAMGST